MSKRLKRTTLLTVAVSGIVLGILAHVVFRSQSSTSKNDSDAVSLIDEETLASLARSKTDIDKSHLAEGLAPLTNKWFSGFVLQESPEPGFFYPGSFRPTDSGFELALPSVSADTKLIAAPHTRDFVITVAEADSYRITAYDELTVTLTYFKDKLPLAEVRVGSGLPYVYVTSRNDTLALSFTGDGVVRDKGTLITVADKSYGLNVPASSNQFSLSDKDTATFFVLPKPADFSTLLSHASARVESASVAYSVDASSAITKFQFKTKNNQPTMFARLPHQTTSATKTAPAYPTVMGALMLDTGTKFSYGVPRISAQQSLEVTELSVDKKNVLREQLLKDVASLPPSPEDTYFGGKQLQRTAQLLDIAAQLGEKSSKQILQNRLAADFTAWLRPGQTGPRSFQYVPHVNGVVGTRASFGSDTQFNDHHFHYGYFVTAAAMLAKYDKDFIKEHESMVNLLVADIANYKFNEQLPLRRNYDPYAGHSWASGTSPFADGNNQESTSEAINAWSGVALWASVVENETLQREAEWMLSNEYATAQRYWLLRGVAEQEIPNAYTSPIVSLLWGGKREYATFFSDEPNAKLAIQLLPVTPTLQSAGLQLTPQELSGTDVTKQYGDAIFMVSPDASLEKAKALPDAAIDDGNSRTYMYAYILTRD
jgi:endo-1,3(4)-beta-glucanase